METRDFFNEFNEIPAVCPKCGYSDYEIEIIDNKNRVVCNVCKLKGPIGINEKEAVEKWNKRITTENICRFCGEKLIQGKCTKCDSEEFHINSNNTKYNCCFIDLLGFSNYTTKSNLRDCVQLIENYATIYEQRCIVNNFRSFKYFHPASDSIFIISNDYDMFIKDISDFCYSSFRMVSNTYICPENNSDVAQTTVSVVSPTGITKEIQHWYPPLFSGGVSIGDLIIFQQESTYDYGTKKVPNFLGDALTKAVHLGEENHKEKRHGSRIFLDYEFVTHLSDDAKRKYVYFHDGIFELLWPVAAFIDANTIDDNINNGITDCFISLESLYKQYLNNAKLEAVYFNTLKLVYFSLLKYLEFRNASKIDIEDAKQLIRNFLSNNNLDLIFDELGNPLIWR